MSVVGRRLPAKFSHTHAKSTSFVIFKVEFKIGIWIMDLLDYVLYLYSVEVLSGGLSWPSNGIHTCLWSIFVHMPIHFNNLNCCVVTYILRSKFWFMVFKATFNNISVISWRSFYWWRKSEYWRKPLTCRKSLTNFIT